jgi:hypothetical protein
MPLRGCAWLLLALAFKSLAKFPSPIAPVGHVANISGAIAVRPDVEPPGRLAEMLKCSSRLSCFIQECQQHTNARHWMVRTLVGLRTLTSRHRGSGEDGSG